MIHKLETHRQITFIYEANLKTCQDRFYWGHRKHKLCTGFKIKTHDRINVRLYDGMRRFKGEVITEPSCYATEYSFGGGIILGGGYFKIKSAKRGLAYSCFIEVYFDKIKKVLDPINRDQMPLWTGQASVGF